MTIAQKLTQVVDQFVAENGSETIMSYGDLYDLRTSPRKYGRFNAKCAFSGKVVCGVCGSKLSRDTWCRKKEPDKKIASWGCIGPRSACSLHRILEEHLLQATASMLAAKDSQPAFAEHVRRALIFNDRVEFELRNGETRTWVRIPE